MKKKQPNKLNQVISFPAKILEPIRNFLAGEMEKLLRREKELKEEDPFSDTRRLIDNAATDLEASEQFGHERTVAFKEQIERRVIQIRKALTMIKLGKYGICEKCGKMIDTDRLMVMPETTVCVACEKKKEE